MDRCLTPELLDELLPEDPQAVRSRRDLRRLNVLMGHHRILAGALANISNGQPAPRLVELGSGDGGCLLRAARRLSWPSAKATLVDRAAVFDPVHRAAFQAQGWQVDPVVADALSWMRQAAAGDTDVVVVNLFLHHLTREQLGEVFGLAARAGWAFVAVEPRRAALPLIFSRLVGLVGCGPVTRHDATASVRAGFWGWELSGLWPAAQNWELSERRAGLFSHLFVARPKSKS
jgi:hypothetical protein